jgi:hypothetical protein
MTTENDYLPAIIDGEITVDAGDGRFVKQSDLAGWDSDDDVSEEGDGFQDGKRRIGNKPKCHGQKSSAPWRDFFIGREEEKPNTDIQTCFRSDVQLEYDPRNFYFEGTWFRVTGCDRAARTLKAWVPTARRYERVSELPDIGDSSAQETDDASRNRAAIERFDAAFPIDKCRDSELIPDKWDKPEKESTKHADISESAKAGLLIYYRAHRDSNESIQTNFFHGDNDNTPDEESGKYVQRNKVAGDWEIRPSVDEMMTAILDVDFEDKSRPAFKDSLGNHRPAMVIPVESAHVQRDEQSRTISERESETAFAKHIEKLSAEQIAEYAKLNAPAYSPPPIRRLGKLCFATSDLDDDEDGRERRGELLTTTSKNGGEYRPRDGIRGSKIVRTAKQTREIKEAEAYRYANLCRDNGVDVEDVSESHVRPLSEAGTAQQLVNEAKQRKARWLTGTSIRPDPAFFTASLTLDEARREYGVKEPSNNNRVYSGLPWVLWSPHHLPTKSGAGSPLLAGSPEDFFIENDSRKSIDAAKTELGPAKVLVLDSFLSSENAAILGSKTGDVDKHERTQERNGKLRLVAVATELTDILLKNAA